MILDPMFYFFKLMIQIVRPALIAAAFASAVFATVSMVGCTAVIIWAVIK